MTDHAEDIEADEGLSDVEYVQAMLQRGIEELGTFGEPVWSNAMQCLRDLESRLRTAEEERDRYKTALETGRCQQCGSWFRGMPDARAALAQPQDRGGRMNDYESRLIAKAAKMAHLEARLRELVAKLRSITFNELDGPASIAAKRSALDCADALESILTEAAIR